MGDARFWSGNVACPRRPEPDRAQADARALDIRALADRDELFDFQHGDGRLKLIERLAAADRANELPDYMREIIASLRSPCRADGRPHRQRRQLSREFELPQRAVHEIGMCPRNLSLARRLSSPPSELPRFARSMASDDGGVITEPLSAREVHCSSMQSHDLRGVFRGAADSVPRALLTQEGLGSRQKWPICRYLSPLPDSNRGPPPYHGGSGAVLAGTSGHARSRFSCKSSLLLVSIVTARARACPV